MPALLTLNWSQTDVHTVVVDEDAFDVTQVFEILFLNYWA